MMMMMMMMMCVSSVLVDTFNDGLECVEVRSFGLVFSPASLHRRHQLLTAAAVSILLRLAQRRVDQRRPERHWALAVLHQLVNLWTTKINTNALLIRNWRTLLHRCAADVSCSFTRWQHFSAWNDVMAAILKAWCQIENPTPSIDAYLFEEHFRLISSRSDLKRRSLLLFWRRSPQQQVHV